MSDPVQFSQICDGKSPLSQSALIVSDPVQVSQIHYEEAPHITLWSWYNSKWLAEVDFPSQIWEALIVSDPVQISPAGHFPSQIWEALIISDPVQP